jgi:hypothetical protein
VTCSWSPPACLRAWPPSPAQASITHPDAATFFDAHVRSGPLRPLADEKGPAFVERLRAEFLRRAPAGEWLHRPNARHVVVVRDPGSP